MNAHILTGFRILSPVFSFVAYSIRLPFLVMKKVILTELAIFMSLFTCGMVVLSFLINWMRSKVTSRFWSTPCVLENSHERIAKKMAIIIVSLIAFSRRDEDFSQAKRKKRDSKLVADAQQGCPYRRP